MPVAAFLSIWLRQQLQTSRASLMIAGGGAELELADETYSYEQVSSTCSSINCSCVPGMPLSLQYRRADC